MEFKRLTIGSITSEGQDFKTFTFEDSHDISYEAGQYLTFVHKTRFEEVRRSYSIISAPVLNEPLSIGVQRIPNGIFSRELVDHAQVGDELVTIGAGGFFLLPEPAGSCAQLFFFAAGSGITPILSLIKTALYSDARVEVILIYSSRSSKSIIYQTTLDALEQLFTPRLKILFFNSDAPQLEKARLTRDRIAGIVKNYHAKRGPALFYICGPEPYMRMCTYALQEEGLPRENIRRENFAIERRRPPLELPPDRETHEVTVVISDKTSRLTVRFPDTILQAAKKQGLDLPYSCEAGRCGSCVAQCTRGKVWLAYNEVLTDKELAEGLTLTCTGHPVYGDVNLKL